MLGVVDGAVVVAAVAGVVVVVVGGDGLVAVFVVADEEEVCTKPTLPFRLLTPGFKTLEPCIGGVLVVDGVVEGLGGVNVSLFTTCW